MNGVLPVDKPEGPTSHDIVARARRGLGIRRVGHTGTLDPFASGLLLLCVGPATRLAQYLVGLDKAYEATARLGTWTDTLDRTGKVIDSTGAWADLSPDQIRAAFEGQVGQRQQRPPAYSAKKVGGRRAYELARGGETVDLAPIEVEIEQLQVLNIRGPDVSFRLRCSSGTYVRSVAADAGEALGVGAYLTRLRRTAVGSVSIDAALPADQLSERDAAAHRLIAPLEALDHMPVVELAADEVPRIRHGQGVPNLGRAPEGLVALARDRSLVAVAEATDQVLRPRRVLA